MRVVARQCLIEQSAHGRGHHADGQGRRRANRERAGSRFAGCLPGGTDRSLGFVDRCLSVMTKCLPGGMRSGTSATQSATYPKVCALRMADMQDMRLSHAWLPAHPGPMAPSGAMTTPASGAAVDEEVLTPLRAYMHGHATGDPAHFRAAFLPSAHVEGIRDGAFVSWTLDDYCALFDGHPAPDEPTRSRRIDGVEVYGSVANAAMTLRHGPDTFTDIFLLVRTADGWRIANKAYHRH